MAKTEPRRGAAGYGHVFSRPLCKNQTEEEVTLAGLYARIKRARAATKKGLRLLKFARFGGVRSDKGSLRHNKNVLAITGVVVDYDGEKVPVGKAYRALRRAGIRALVYTSPSHTPDKPRWRIICIFSKELRPDQHYQMVARVNGVVGCILARESFTLSQPYYYGAVGYNPPPLAKIIDGTPIDLRDDLDAGAIGKSEGVAGTGKASTAGINTGNVASLAGKRPKLATIRTSAILNAAAQAGVECGWFERVLPEKQNDLLRAVAADPRVTALANQSRDPWKQLVWAFADAERLGATEAKEIAREWSQKGASDAHPYTEEGFDNIWESFDPNRLKPTTVGTLLDAVTKAGFDVAPWRDRANGATTVVGVSLADFYAYMPMHNYIFEPSRAMWPVESVNSRIRPIKLKDANGQPVLDGNGKQVALSASAWLDRFKPVEQMTWAPGLPLIVRDKLILDGGWIERRGVSCFNLYLPPTITGGDASQVGPWVDHLRYVYPDDAEHILDWLAHRVQRPQEKINHSLVLGGTAGIGKDTILEPVKYAVGPWNFQEVTPKEILDKYSSYLKSVILRINEARDLGEFDRFQFYEHTKIYMASPPDVLPISEKHIKRYVITNVCGVVITTNHKTDGIYLPADDRRHYVAWSDRKKEDPKFQGNYWTDMWNYYEKGGKQHIAAYLRQRDISKFDPKAPPPKTPTFWLIVNSGRSSEEAELADALDGLGNPEAVTLGNVTDHLLGKSAANGNARIPGAPINMNGQDTAKLEFAFWLRDRKNRRVIPHRFEGCGYVPVRNPDDKRDGQWKIGGSRQTVYAKEDLPVRDQIGAARKLTRAGPPA